MDGILSKYWRSQTVSNTSPLAWVQVDLQSAQTISRAVVTWMGNYFAKTYQVQVSSDAVNWTAVHTNNAGAAGTQDISFPATTARYVRLYCSARNLSSYRVYEFEIYSGGLAKGSGTTEAEQDLIPREIALLQNYPNPFNPSTNISYSLPAAAPVTLRVYDVIGNVVARLVNGVQPAGVHTVHFNAGHLSAGTYYYVLQTGETRIVRRLALVK